MSVRLKIFSAWIVAPLALACSTGPTIRAPATFTAELASRLNIDASGKTLEVDVAGKQDSLEANKVMDVSKGTAVFESPGGASYKVSLCRVREIRFYPGSNSRRGFIIGGAIALGFLTFMAAAPFISRDEVKSDSDIPLPGLAIYLAPYFLLSGSGIGALAGWVVPRGPVIYPMLPPGPTEGCR